MSIEKSLQTVLTTVCPRVRATVGDHGFAVPFIVWQTIGGEPINAMDNSLPGQRRPLVQISVWASSQLEAQTLAQDAEAALRASNLFTATPSGEAITAPYEPDTKRYGTIRRFNIWGDR